MINSLRVQITGLYLLFFTVVFLLLGIFLYGLRARGEYKQMDDLLDSQVSTAAVIFHTEFGESSDAYRAARETIAEIRIRGAMIAIFEGARLLAGTANMNRPRFFKAAAQLAGAESAQLVSTIPASRHKGDRVLARRLSIGNRTFIFMAVQSIDAVAEDLHHARRIFFITLPIVVVIVGVGGFLLTTRGLASVRRMAEQAKTITDRNLRGGLNAGATTQELRLLADSFNELLARLDRSFTTMHRFVADASHELRTPLSIILGEADVALSTERPAADYKASIVIMQDEARRLSRLVDDLLNLTRADGAAASLRVEPFYLDDLLGECCRSVHALARSKQIEVRCRCPEDVLFHGDPALLRRLVLNLLDNALRYTPPGGHISVNLDAAESDLRIQVSDTGIGIPPEAVPHVFERFYRADEARSRAQGGFGLGLSIVKWIAESHNGTVQLDSRPGVGSTFTVLLHK